MPLRPGLRLPASWAAPVSLTVAVALRPKTGAGLSGCGYSFRDGASLSGAVAAVLGPSLGTRRGKEKHQIIKGHKRQNTDCKHASVCGTPTTGLRIKSALSVLKEKAAYICIRCPSKGWVITMSPQYD